MRSDIVRPGMPRLYNLLTDPKENYDLIEKGGKDGEDNFWVMPAISKLVAPHGIAQAGTTHSAWHPRSFRAFREDAQIARREFDADGVVWASLTTVG